MSYELALTRIDEQGHPPLGARPTRWVSGRTFDTTDPADLWTAMVEYVTWRQLRILWNASENPYDPPLPDVGMTTLATVGGDGQPIDVPVITVAGQASLSAQLLPTPETRP